MPKFWSGNVIVVLNTNEMGDYLLREYAINGNYVAIRDYIDRVVVEWNADDHEFKSLGAALDRLDIEATKAAQVREF